MKSTKKSIVDIIRVAFSNVLSFLASVLVGFLVPKIMGVTDYGYYKIFTLYASYVGFFGLGIIDGIYLKYGGLSYECLDKSNFRKFTRLVFILQLFFAFVIIVLALVFLKEEYRFIFAAVAIFLLLNNIIGYFQIISQITSRFKELSIRNIIQSSLMVCSVVSLWLINKYGPIDVDYKLYVILYLSVFAFLALWYCLTYRELFLGPTDGFINKETLKELILLGIPLLFANLCSSLILSIDRQFVSVLYDTDTYAVYSFAYNMLALITTVTSAISIVIYPIIKQSDEGLLIKRYSILNTLVLGLVFFGLLIYYPLCWLVNLILPQYHNSLNIFLIILPGLAISSAISIVMHNYYKAFDINHHYFIKTIIVLLFSFVMNCLFYILWNSPAAISAASILSLLLWYVLTEIELVKRYKVKNIKNYLYLFSMIIGFYVISLIFSNNYVGGFLVYAVFYIFVSLMLFHKEICLVLKKRKRTFY